MLCIFISFVGLASYKCYKEVYLLTFTFTQVNSKRPQIIWVENSLKRGVFFFFFSPFVKAHGFLGLSGAISQKQEQIKGGNDMFVIL